MCKIPGSMGCLQCRLFGDESISRSQKQQDSSFGFLKSGEFESFG